MLALAGASERGSGFATSVVLTNSVHPLAFLQALVARLFGDVSNLTAAWWGVNFFHRGFPYIVSLYLGPIAIVLAICGLGSRRPGARRLGALALLAAFAALGQHASWQWFFDLSPSLRSLRYPVKALYTVQFAVALLAAFALDALSRADSATRTRLVRGSLMVGGLLVTSALAPLAMPNAVVPLLEGFVPPSVTAEQRLAIAGVITQDAATGGVVTLLAGVLAFLATRNRIASSRAAIGVVALIAADLIRAGTGLNPGVTQSFFDLSPEMAPAARSLAASHARVFTCDVESSDGYWEGRRLRRGIHEIYTMAAFAETLTPDTNTPNHVRTALSIDRTMLVPTARVLSPQLASCKDLATVLPKLRAASVGHVLSLDRLAHPELQLVAEVAPRRIDPAIVRIYALSNARPRLSHEGRFVADGANEVAFDVNLRDAGTVVLHDAMGPGWRATANGRAIEIHETPEGHRAVSLPAGQHRVVMTYEPQGLRAGVAVTLLAIVVSLVLAFRGSRPSAVADSPKLLGENA
jgi:hypothetical protein